MLARMFLRDSFSPVVHWVDVPAPGLPRMTLVGFSRPRFIWSLRKQLNLSLSLLHASSTHYHLTIHCQVPRLLIPRSYAESPRTP